jgi:hypothetical protein
MGSNLHRGQGVCISESKLALSLDVVTNAAEEIKLPACIDLRVEKSIIPRVAKRLDRAVLLSPHACAHR